MKSITAASAFIAVLALALPAQAEPLTQPLAEKLPPPITVAANTEIKGKTGRQVQIPVLWEKVRPQTIPAQSTPTSGTMVISSQTIATQTAIQSQSAAPALPLATPAPATATIAPEPTTAANSLQAPTLAAAPPAANSAAEPVLKSTQFQSNGYGEVGGNFDYVSGGLGNWSGAYFRSAIQTDPKNIWSLDTTYQNQFHDNGFFASVGNTHLFNANWFTNVAFGASTDGFFFPGYRADAFLNYKVPDSRQFIATVGLGASDARDTDNSDVSVFLGGSYYFQEPWIVQGGIRYNISSPGSVGSTSEFIAITQGRVREHFYTIRYGFGEEAYQVIDNNRSITDFNDQTVTLEARQWFGEDWGINARGEYEHNPTYDRTGLRLGVFKEF